MDSDNETVTVNCDTCDNSDYGLKSDLERAGWQISEHLELCANYSI